MADEDATAVWSAPLRGVPAGFDLPVRTGDPAAERGATHTVGRTLTESTAALLAEHCAGLACRPEDLLLAVAAAAVAFWANQPRIAFRVTAGTGARRRTMPVPFAIGAGDTLTDLAGRARGTARRVAEADGVSVAAIRHALGIDHDRPMWSELGYASIDDPADELLGADDDAELTVRTWRRGTGFGLALRARRIRYRPADLDELADRFVGLLAAALARPREALARLPLGPAGELARVAARCQGPVQPRPAQTACARIAEMARSAPERTAVVGPSGTLTYAELMAAAGDIARRLGAHGWRGRTVAVHLERDVHWLPAILGIWLAGCVYLPLNTAWPPARLELVLTDADAAGVLVSPRTHASGRLARRPLVVLTSEPKPATAPGPDRPEVGMGAPAYVLYTSGSTGRPKGVLVEQPALSNLLQAMAGITGLGPDDRMLASSAPTFDISLVEFLLPLMVGGTCVVADDAAAAEPALLAALVVEQRVTAVQATPTMWALLLEHLTDRIPLALSGGEPLDDDLRDRLCRQADRAFNCYGPTEATIWATAWRLAEGVPVSVGRPLANTRAWVLDRWQRPCPVGTVGELVLSGAGIAWGYLNRPEGTAQAFRPGIAGFDDGRAYRTGDLASWGPDGQIFLHGRADEQIKLRGVRIEPGEVEIAIRGVAGVRGCAVVAYHHRGGAGLAAFVVAAPPSGDILDPDLDRAVRDRVAETLPHYTRPQAYFGIAALPVSASGKLDRAALAELAVRRLAEPAPEVGAGAGIDEPVTSAVAAVWREVLGVAVVDGESRFFAIGGDSLSALRVVARTNRMFGTGLALLDLVRNPTLRAFARLVAAATDGRRHRSAGTVRP